MKLKPTVLIVDDEPWGRESLESLLITQDYNLAFAANGAEALAKAADLVPDLILLDIMMPDMDGFEVCEQLRQDRVLADVPVIMVTALDDRDSRVRGIEAGADDFVSKPFDRIELRSRVSTITRLNRFRRMLAERTKFEWVVERATDGYLLIDDGGHIHYANQKARLYLGLSAEEDCSVNETFHQLIRKQYHPEPATAWSIWPDHTSYGKPRYLVRPETAASHAFWLQVDTLSLDLGSNNGNKGLWIVHLHDVTDQMALQRDKWHFQAMVAHKFRTPLIPLVTGLDLIEKHADNLSPDEIKTIVNKAVKGIKRLRGEIEDILEYVHNSGASASADRFSLGQIETLATTIANDLEITHLEIDLSGCQASPTQTVNIRTEDIDLILRQIFENSVKFHPRQSPMLQITVTKARYKDAIILKLADDGIHLSSEQLNLVWTPYYQGEKYFTGEVPGMGLGLSMVASIIWNSGGSCRMYNRLEKPGIVIELVIPFVTT